MQPQRAGFWNTVRQNEKQKFLNLLFLFLALPVSAGSRFVFRLPLLRRFPMHLSHRRVRMVAPLQMCVNQFHPLQSPRNLDETYCCVRHHHRFRLRWMGSLSD